MKKLSKWALLGAVGGALFIIMAAVRYYILYPDIDKCIAYILLGLVTIAVSFLYNRELQMTHDIEAIEDFISDQQDRIRERARLKAKLKLQQQAQQQHAQQQAQQAAAEHEKYKEDYDKFVTEAQEAQESEAI